MDSVGGRPEGLLGRRAEVGVGRFDSGFMAFRIGDRNGPVLRGVLRVPQPFFTARGIARVEEVDRGRHVEGPVTADVAVFGRDVEAEVGFFFPGQRQLAAVGPVDRGIFSRFGGRFRTGGFVLALSTERVRSGLRARLGGGREFPFFQLARFLLLRVGVTPVDAVGGRRRPRLDAAALRVRVGEAGGFDLRAQRVERRRVFGVGTEDVHSFVRRRRVAVGDAVDTGDPHAGFTGRAGGLRDRRFAFGREFTRQIRFERTLTADVATEEGGHRGQAHLLLVTHQSRVTGHPGVDRGIELGDAFGEFGGLFTVAPTVRLGFTGDGLEVRAGFAGEADVVRVFRVQGAEDVLFEP